MMLRKTQLGFCFVSGLPWKSASHRPVKRAESLIDQGDNEHLSLQTNNGPKDINISDQRPRATLSVQKIPSDLVTTLEYYIKHHLKTLQSKR